jgi:hypothetical protein
MRTPLNILLNKIENGDFTSGNPKVIGEFIKYNLLEKEKEHILSSWHNGYENQSPMIDEDNCGQQYYKETYE